MVTLYFGRGCPYSKKVFDAIHTDIVVDVNIRYIRDEHDHYEEVEEQGGKVQVPYMVDDATGTKLYESDDIIAYLKEHYGGV